MKYWDPMQLEWISFAGVNGPISRSNSSYSDWNIGESTGPGSCTVFSRNSIPLKERTIAFITDTVTITWNPVAVLSYTLQLYCDPACSLPLLEIKLDSSSTQYTLTPQYLSTLLPNNVYRVQLVQTLSLSNNDTIFLGDLLLFDLGTKLVARLESTQLRISCNGDFGSLMNANDKAIIPTILFFFPVSSETRLSQCNPVGGWVGTWSLVFNLPLPDEKYYWWICIDPHSNLISSIGYSSSSDSLATIVFYSTSMSVIGNNINATFSSFASQQIRLNGTKDHSGVLKGNIEYNDGSGIWTEARIDSSYLQIEGDPLPSSCSPAYAFSGVWLHIDTQTYFYLCAEAFNVIGNSQIYTFNSNLVFDSSSKKWVLVAQIKNRISHTLSETVILFLDTLSKESTVINNLETQSDLGYGYVPWATLVTNQYTSCPLPLVSGIWYHHQLQQELYICVEGNSAFGCTEDTNRRMQAELSFDLKVSGSWSIKGGTTYEVLWQYSITNTEDKSLLALNFQDGITLPNYVSKLSDKSTLSQCYGAIQKSAYEGHWGFPQGNLSLCVSSDSKVIAKLYIKGKNSPAILTGNFANGVLSGEYNISGLISAYPLNWTAKTDLEELQLTLTGFEMFPGLALGNRISYATDALNCGSWNLFWSKKYGSDIDLELDDHQTYFGGCFTVCFQENQIDFEILFIVSQIHGTGELKSDGTLVGSVYLKTENSNINFEISPGNIVTGTFSGKDEIFKISYKNCTDTKFFNMDLVTVNCDADFFQPALIYSVNSTLKPSNPITFSSVDILSDGTRAMSKTGNTFRLYYKGTKSWDLSGIYSITDQSQIQLGSTPPDVFPYNFLKGNDVVISSDYYYLIYGENVYFWFHDSDLNGKPYNKLNKPDGCGSKCWPMYLLKSYTTLQPQILVLWAQGQDNNATNPLISQLCVYENSESSIVLSQTVNDIYVVAASMDDTWLAYTTLDTQGYQIEVNVISLADTDNSSSIKVGVTTFDETTSFGFSLAIEGNTLLTSYAGLPGVWGKNYGSVFVWKYDSSSWFLKTILDPPDGGYYQSFGRSVALRGKRAIIQKAHDNTIRLQLPALFVYEEINGAWKPTAKLINPGFTGSWDIKYFNNTKRQYIRESPLTRYSETPILWGMSYNGPLFITNQDGSIPLSAWHSCPTNKYGINCENNCVCDNGGICTGNIVGFQCDCPPQYYGTTCSQTCQNCNNGTCSDGALGTGFCICPPFTTYGNFCLPCTCKSSDPQHWNYGALGDGHCKQCTPGLYGIDCELKCSCDNGTKCDDGPLGTGNCLISGSNSDGYIIGGVVAVVVIIIAIILFIIYKRRSQALDLTFLPEKLRWYFDPKRFEEGGWEPASSKSQNLRKDITKDKKYLARLDYIFKHLHSSQIKIEEVFAVYNFSLIAAFQSQYNIVSTRHRDSPTLFCKKDWKNSSLERRNWVYTKYEERINTFEWNKDLQLPILPAIHGTDKTIAWSICASGFAALSTLDAGYYGKGIYFSCSCLYTVPYYGTKAGPTILVCLLIPGNVRPIIEGKDDPGNHMGIAIDSGYQSHYVCCRKDGAICPIDYEDWYDEIVIAQEGQIVPIFVVHVDRSCLPGLVAKFQREIPTTTEKYKASKTSTSASRTETVNGRELNIETEGVEEEEEGRQLEVNGTRLLDIEDDYVTFHN